MGFGAGFLGLCGLSALSLCASGMYLATEAKSKLISPPIENRPVRMQIVIINCGSALRLAAGRCDCQSVVKIAKEIQTGTSAEIPNLLARPACSQVFSAMLWPRMANIHQRFAGTVAAPSASSQALLSRGQLFSFTVFGQVFFCGGDVQTSM